MPLPTQLRRPNRVHFDFMQSSHRRWPDSGRGVGRLSQGRLLARCECLSIALILMDTATALVYNTDTPTSADRLRLRTRAEVAELVDAQR